MAPVFKVLIVGDGGVGKTSLIKRFKNIPHRRNNTDFSECIEVGNLTFGIIENIGDITWKTWDGIIVMFDLTSLPTFKKVKSLIKEAREHSLNSPPVILCGNKVDLKDKRDVKQYRIEEVKEKFKVEYLEISAQTGENCEKPFEQIIGNLKKKLGQKLMDAVGDLDLANVIDLLEYGADPDYFDESYKEIDYHPSVTWEDQPYTPLRLVIFISSDCCLEDGDQETLAKIAKCLLDKGADPRSALTYADERYGKFTQSTRFLAWRVIHSSDKMCL